MKRKTVDAARTGGSPLPAGVEKATPKYSDIGEATVVDLSADGLPYLPALGEAHYTKVGNDPELHVHPGMVEILLCRRGRGLTIDCGDHVHPFPTGTVMVLQPEVPHVIRPKPKNLSTTWVWFRLPEGGAPLPGFSLRETRWLVGGLRSLPIRFPASKELVFDFRRVWNVYRNVSRRSPERRLLLREAVLRLFIDVFEASRADGREEDDARLAALLERMRGDCAREWTLEELSALAAMSVPKLTDRVRQRTGLPPHQFLLLCRIEKAKELLAGPERSIGAVANLVGIASARHFATLFKRETGQTPRQWRAASRAASDPFSPASGTR